MRPSDRVLASFFETSPSARAALLACLQHSSLLGRAGRSCSPISRFGNELLNGLGPKLTLRKQLMLGLFGKKKDQPSHENNSQESQEPIVLSKLQEITAGDDEMYRSLSRLLFLDPKKITTSLEDAVSQATAFDSAGNRTRAEVWYRIAGGIALYRGDQDGVRKFFEKASSIAGDRRPEYKTIASRSQDAVNLARKFYESM